MQGGCGFCAVDVCDVWGGGGEARDEAAVAGADVEHGAGGVGEEGWD